MSSYVIAGYVATVGSLAGYAVWVVRRLRAHRGNERHAGQVVKRRRALVIVVVAVLAAGGLLWKALGDATVYFKTADEAAAERASLGDRRFRLEGLVLAGSLKSNDEGVRFVVAENGARIAVHHRGDPPELFREGIPVVLEGRFQGETYESDRILVKHTSEYRKINPDRVKDYGPEK